MRKLLNVVSRWWSGGIWRRIGLLATALLLCMCTCCSSLVVFAATPYGQQLARETEATETASALANAKAAATATEYARLHPSPTSTPRPTARPRTSSTAIPTPTRTPTPAHTFAPTATATPHRPPTATPVPTISINAATLGGSVKAFDNKFGDNNCCREDGWDYQGPFGATWTGVYAGDSNFDWLSNSRVFGVLTEPQPSGQSWDASQTGTMQSQFMPSDAVLKSTQPAYLGNLVEGQEKTYFSALLAHTLPASDFKDNSGNLVQPGTVYVYLHFADYGNDSSHFDQCALSTDEHFALNPF